MSTDNGAEQARGKLKIVMGEPQVSTGFLCGENVNFSINPSGINFNDAKKIQANYKRHIVY